MRPVPSSILLHVFAAVGLFGPIHAQQESVFDAGARSQLFINQHLVHETERIAFTPHPARKHPGNPLMRADQPWEGWAVTAFAGTVLFDEEERRFKMWYQCRGNPEYFDKGGTCYAVSTDGLHWEKPTVGTCEASNGKPHSLVSRFLCPSVVKDTADADPAGRFKMICFDKNRGYLALLSPDGLRWTEQSSRPIVPISYVDDVISAFRDRRSGDFVALPKMMTPVFGRSRRSIYSSTSHDFSALVETPARVLRRPARRSRLAGPHRAGASAAQSSRQLQRDADGVLRIGRVFG